MRRRGGPTVSLGCLLSLTKSSSNDGWRMHPNVPKSILPAQLSWQRRSSGLLPFYPTLSCFSL